jgi:hypothetical protein
MSRREFRERCVERDGGECLVPWCSEEVTVAPDGSGEVHHVVDRELWNDGGYIRENGACVCNVHHQMAEQNEIPPQAFWRWVGIEEIPVPSPQGDTIWNMINGKDNVIAIDKWGEPFETPPHGDLREYHKYPSTRHLLPLYWQSERGTQEERTGRDDTGLSSVESFLDIPLVTTIKMDGSNAMLVADTEEPVRARNGRDATHESFDHLKQEYWDRNVYENLPEYLQVFGENMYSKHSIHYGCPNDDCGGCDERNQGPPVDDVFLVFGVYDTRYDLWLSWPETERVADEIGFPTAPMAYTDCRWEHGEWSFNYVRNSFDGEQEFVEHFTSVAESVVDQGHEGIILRSLYPIHYAQFARKLGKYVRPNHVQTDEHWSHQPTTRNEVESE